MAISYPKSRYAISRFTALLCGCLCFFAQASVHSSTSGSIRPDIHDATFAQAVTLIDAGAAEELADLLKSHPGLIRQRLAEEGEYSQGYFARPTLLHFTAYNPFWRRDITISPRLPEVVEVLLQAGAEVDASCGEGLNSWTTLGLVTSGTLLREAGVENQVIDLLVRYGADPSLGLPGAVIYSDWEALDALVENGLDPSPLLLATQEDAAALKASIADVDARTLQTALFAATVRGRPANVEVLLSAGAEVNAYMPEPYHSHATALHQAALQGHVDVLKVMIEHGADLQLKDKIYKGTPLGWAGHNHQDATSDFLLELGVYEPTAQQLAAWGKVARLRKLFEATPERVNAVNDWGTPMQQAAYHGRLEVMRLLLELGADINKAEGGDRVPGSGQTPLDKALSANRKEAAEWLSQHGGKTSLPQP